MPIKCESPHQGVTSKDVDFIKEEVEPMEVDELSTRNGPENSENNPKTEVSVPTVKIQLSEEVTNDQKKFETSDHSMNQHQHIEVQITPPNILGSQQLNPPSKSQNVDLELSSNVELPVRKLVLSIPELIQVVGWNRTDLPITFEDVKTDEPPRKRHPILHLEKLLRECSEEEESLENLHENVVGLIRILDDDSNQLSEYKRSLLFSY